MLSAVAEDPDEETADAADADDAEAVRAEKLPKAKIVPVEPEKDKPAEDARPKRPPQTPRQSLMRFVNTMVFTLIIFYFISPDFQSSLVGGADAVLYPAIGFGGQFPLVTLLLAGLLMSALSTLIAHFLTDFVRQARMQRQNAALQKESFAAMKARDQKRVERIAKVRQKSQEENMDMMWAPMKVMGYTMLVILVNFSWMGTAFVLSLYRPEATGHSVFSVPWASRVDFYQVTVFPHWVLLYSLLAIPFGALLRRMLRYVAFRKRLAARAAEATAQVLT